MNVDIYPKDWTGFCLHNQEKPMWDLTVLDRDGLGVVRIHANFNQLLELKALIEVKIDESLSKKETKQIKLNGDDT